MFKIENMLTSRAIWKGIRRVEGPNDICAAFLPAITRPTANCK